MDVPFNQEMLNSLAESVPDLVVLLVLVVVFMRAQRGLVESFAESVRTFIAYMHDNDAAMGKIITENTKMLGAALRYIELESREKLKDDNESG